MALTATDLIALILTVQLSVAVKRPVEEIQTQVKGGGGRRTCKILTLVCIAQVLHTGTHRLRTWRQEAEAHKRFRRSRRRSRRRGHIARSSGCSGRSRSGTRWARNGCQNLKECQNALCRWSRGCRETNSSHPNHHLLHALSSDPSSQSNTPLHTLTLGTHCPLAQVASWGPHTGTGGST